MQVKARVYDPHVYPSVTWGYRGARRLALTVGLILRNPGRDKMCPVSWHILDLLDKVLELIKRISLCRRKVFERTTVRTGAEAPWGDPYLNCSARRGPRLRPITAEFF
jgi:hypothetical protein